MSYIKKFVNLNKDSVAIAGGKGASLGEMTQASIPVPPGFVVLSPGFDQFLKETDLNVEIEAILSKVNTEEVHTVEQASAEIQALILDSEMPQDIANEVTQEFKKLQSEFVAVRSSATSEDSATAAWAGQLDSFLNTTQDNLLENIKKCWASLFTPRAIFYRFEKELHKQEISVAVVIQKMIQSEVSGIAFSVHPVTEDRNQLIIEAAFGLGEAIVSGQITPDSYVVQKTPRKILDKNIFTQEKGLFKSDKGGNEWQDIKPEQGEKQVLSDQQIIELSDLILNIEKHYNFPCDIEFALENDTFYVVQSRPITTLGEPGKKFSLKDALGLDMSDWEFEFQQRDGHPLIMADQWSKSLQGNLVEEVNLDVEGFDYLFTGEYKGYVKTNQKQKLLTELFSASKKDEYFNFVLDRTISRVKELEVFCSETRNNLPKTKKEIITTWNVFNELFFKVIPWFYIPYYLSEKDILTNKVKVGLVKHEKNISTITDLNNALALICFPVKKNSVQLEQEFLYKLANLASKDDNFVNNLDFKKLASDYLDNFAWMKTFIELPKEVLTFDELVLKVGDSLKSDFIGQYTLQIEQKKKNDQLLDKINNVISEDEKLKDDIEHAQKLGWVLSVSVENSLKALSDLIPFFKIIATNIGVSYQDWVNFTVDEINDILSGADIQFNVGDRKKGYVYVLEKGKRKIVFGQEALSCTEEIKFLTEKVDSNISEIKGSPTSPGIVRGKIKLAMNPDSAKNLKLGEILVCGMTSPDYVPAMKLAGAIVTDEGGLLSHAAIISRELGKPCIVGTKIASKVLKDGDEVEVDANEGMIKLLSQNDESDLSPWHEWGRWMDTVFFASLDCATNQSNIFKELGLHKQIQADALMLDGHYFSLVSDVNKIRVFVKNCLGDRSEWFDNFFAICDRETNKLLDLEQNKNINHLILQLLECVSCSKLINFLDDGLVRYIAKIANQYKISYSYIVSQIYPSKQTQIMQYKERIKNLPEQDIDSVLNEYGWVGTRLFNGDSLSEGTLIDDSKDVTAENHGGIDNSLPNAIKELVAIASELTFQRTNLAEVITRVSYRYWSEINTMLKNEGLSFNDVGLFTYYEFLNFITAKFIPSNLNERRNKFGIEFVNNQWRIITDESEIKKLLPNTKQNSEVLDLKGIAANGGQALGTVRIVNELADIKNIKQGDVVVASETTTDYTPFLKKVSAIITEQGGITSHAAIIARELQKPCIIGVVDATRKLQGGEIVQVDADRGIIIRI